MHFAVILFGAFLLSLRASAQQTCSHFIPVHEIIAAPDGVLNIEDEEGARQIKATVFNTPDCQMNPVNPTGGQFGENYTLIGQAGQNSDSCEIKTFGGVPTVDSFQAVVIETNGWPLNNISFTFDDFDSSSSAQWKEAGAVFGVRNGVLIEPTVELHEGSHLTASSFNIPVSSTSLMGFNLGSITVPGMSYTATELHNCPFENSAESRKCRATISFPSPVDSIAIMYTLVSRGSTSSRSGAFFSQLVTSCGCRCRDSNPGTRMITSAVPGSPGQCVRKETSGPKAECDVLGSQWCKKEDLTDWVLTGNTLPNGNLECEERTSTKVVAQSAFSPEPNFGGSR